MKNILNEYIPDRVRIIKDEKDVTYIYQLLGKHFMKSVSELKELYDIELKVIRSEIWVKGKDSDIYLLLTYLRQKQVNILGYDMDNFRVEIDDFVRKIY